MVSSYLDQILRYNYRYNSDKKIYLVYDLEDQENQSRFGRIINPASLIDQRINQLIGSSDLPDIFYPLILELKARLNSKELFTPICLIIKNLQSIEPQMDISLAESLSELKGLSTKNIGFNCLFGTDYRFSYKKQGSISLYAPPAILLKSGDFQKMSAIYSSFKKEISSAEESQFFYFPDGRILDHLPLVKDLENTSKNTHKFATSSEFITKIKQIPDLV